MTTSHELMAETGLESQPGSHFSVPSLCWLLTWATISKEKSLASRAQQARVPLVTQLTTKGDQGGWNYGKAPEKEFSPLS